MPLDPQIEGLLQLMQQAGNASLANGGATQAREMFRMFTVGLRDPSTLAPVRATDDIEIPGPAGPIPARVYRPDVDGPTPTMLFIHGGGFVIGDIDTHDDHVRLICRGAATVVVSIDYRLAPEHKFPAGYDDCLAALRWVGEHVAELGGDPDRLAVGGDSAGGNLSAAVALASREDGPPLAAQLLLYPGVDFVEADGGYLSRVDNAEGYFLTADDMLWFREQYLPDDAAASDIRASVIREQNLAGAPPAIIATAEYDPLRDEGEAYAKALADAGVDVRLHRYDGLIHGFFGLGVHSAVAAAAVQELCAELKSILG